MQIEHGVMVGRLINVLVHVPTYINYFNEMLQ